MNIVGKRVTLRAVEVEDLIHIHEWSNEQETCYMIGGWHFPSSMFHMNKWYDDIQQDENNQRFAIEAEKRLIGTANLVNINWKDNNASHGILIGDKDIRGKGYGKDTVMTIMRYAFTELGLNRLDTSIIEYNQISYNLYIESCGWKEEGRRRKWYFRKNKYWDKIIIGITKDDYVQLITENKYWET